MKTSRFTNSQIIDIFMRIRPETICPVLYIQGRGILKRN